ncbi:MAG: hypothetical protein HY800_03160, partial [Ignavibacteriales bacterium]|nr:hypothetical protein [Ignavibacteriales bacterium]
MKSSIIITATLLCWISSFSQFQQTPPQQITTGNEEDTQPAFVNSQFPTWLNEEWLAFTRFNFIGSNICLKHTSDFARTWEDTVYYMTDDSASNVYPSLARSNFGYYDQRMMLVWQRFTDIYYRYYRDSIWGPMRPLTYGPHVKVHPDIAPRDSGFGCVWEQNGEIAF